MKFTFVILHYQTYQDTVECVESILNCINYNDYNIVVVDNASTNGSTELLYNRYKDIEKVILIKNEKNLGFAKGNNRGFWYAKKELGSDFVILINNDTIINQSDFLTLVLKKYNEKKYHILGPDIVTIKDKKHQNPQRTDCMSIAEIKKNIVVLQVKLFLNILGIEELVSILYKYFKKTLKKDIKNANLKENWMSERENIQLHGSCLIFSPLYVNKYNGLYDQTFMYYEEDILFYISKVENLKTLYSPEIKILHKEDVSTDYNFKKYRQKRNFVYKNMKNSLKELLKIRNNYKLFLNNIHKSD